MYKLLFFAFLFSLRWIYIRADDPASTQSDIGLDLDENDIDVGTESNDNPSSTLSAEGVLGDADSLDVFETTESVLDNTDSIDATDSLDNTGSLDNTDSVDNTADSIDNTNSKDDDDSIDNTDSADADSIDNTASDDNDSIDNTESGEDNDGSSIDDAGSDDGDDDTADTSSQDGDDDNSSGDNTDDQETNESREGRVSTDGDDDEEEDECSGLSRSECAETDESADGDQTCGYNARTQECYSVERRAGNHGIGNFDDGYIAAQEEASEEASSLEALVGLLSGVVGCLLMIVMGGAYWFYTKSSKDHSQALDMLDGPVNGQTINIPEDGIELIGNRITRH